jgi:uncharacterized membrane protein
MPKRPFLALIALVLVSSVISGPSWAGFRVCNRSSQRVDVALGYPHGQFGWTAEGWWTLEPGNCKRVMNGDLTNRYYYLYATGSKGGIWQAKKGQEGGFFCIKRSRFVLQNRNFLSGSKLDCGANNLESRQFFIVDTEGAPNHVHNLKD